MELEGEVVDAIDVPTGCRFKNRFKEYIGDVCDQVSPPLEQKADVDDEREIACHLYESAEGFDPYEELEGASEPGEEDDPAQVPSDDD